MKRIEVTVGELVEDSDDLEKLDLDAVEAKLKGLVTEKLQALFPRETFRFTRFEIEGRDDVGTYNNIVVDGRRHNALTSGLDAIIHREYEQWWTEKEGEAAEAADDAS